MKYRGLLATLLVAIPSTARAQLIPVKTVPLAQADQFQIFPSRAAGMGGVSIALTDTLYDLSLNPATGGRLTAGRVFGSPFLSSVSSRASRIWSRSFFMPGPGGIPIVSRSLPVRAVLT